MEGYWIYVIIGLVVLVLAGLGYWYYRTHHNEKQLRKDLFEGDAFCVVVNKIKEGSSVLGKRKTIQALKFTKSMPNEVDVNALFVFYVAEGTSERDKSCIKQCFKNMAIHGVKTPQLPNEEG
jgi:hypothetical protein